MFPIVGFWCEMLCNSSARRAFGQVNKGVQPISKININQQNKINNQQINNQQIKFDIWFGVGYVSDSKLLAIHEAYLAATAVLTIKMGF